MSLISTLELSILADFEHNRTTRPSAIIQTFLFFSTLLGIPHLRTVWLLDGGSIVAGLYTVTFVLQVVIITLESILKWRHVTGDPEATPPEERQGIFGRIFFWWLMPLFFKGYERDISMDDLFLIDDDLKGTILSERLKKSWNVGM